MCPQPPPPTLRHPPPLRRPLLPQPQLRQVTGLTVWERQPTAGHWLTGCRRTLQPGTHTPAPTAKPGTHRIWHNCGMVTTPPTRQSGIFKPGGLPDQYATGWMMSSYSMPNTYTVICTLRQNVYWQNIAPTYGRQFTSADIVAHYNRLLGLGGGFTKDPYYVSVTGWNPLLSVVATDKYTVTFNWQQGVVGPTSILTIMEAAGADDSIEAPDAVAAYTTSTNAQLNNWHNAVGTGPFILTDFVDGSSATYIANPNYWGTDLRWPQNKLPYISTLKMLIIPSNPTAEAAMRVGKIDGYGSMPTQDALNMMKTNPEIVVKQKPQGNEYTLDPRNDVAPFNNINVRIAMQHAIDIKTITATYYQGYGTPWPASITENQMGIGGWGDPYPQWPADVQATYTYDPTLPNRCWLPPASPTALIPT